MDSISRKLEKLSDPPIYLLPYELHLKILGCVATSSVSDLLRVKKSCKFLKEVADDDNIYRQIRLDQEYPVGLWLSCSNMKASSFFTKCKGSGNPEALYIHGVIEYHTSCREAGLDFLKKAAAAGHLAASYLVGIILICSEKEFIRKGIDLIKTIETNQIRKCRNKLTEIVSQLRRKKRSSTLKWTIFVCPKHKHTSEGYLLTVEPGQKRGDELSCYVCRWNREIYDVCLDKLEISDYSYRIAWQFCE